MGGDGGVLGATEAVAYESVQAAKTAGLVAPLKAAGAVVLWRCHIGADAHNDWTQEA
ncbi:MAG TPA: hypothetical protein VMU64_08190 [Acidimicrobiales bacterium]|nr:hypothetical protein [Acidimicrobiales bacterium]